MSTKPTSVRLRTKVLLVTVLVVPNALGGGVVLALAAFILPRDPGARDASLLLTNLIAFAGYVLVAIAVGIGVGSRAVRSSRAATDGPDEAHARFRRVVLRAPLRLAIVQAALWLAAAVLFLLLNVFSSWRVALQTLGAVLIGGLATVALTYRLVEVVLRPEARRVLTGTHIARRRGIPRIVVSTLGGWLFGTAAPLLGIMLAAVGALAFGNYSLDRLAVVVLVLGGLALLLGGIVITLTATSMASPILGVRRALQQVERGNLDAQVPVSDTSELGQLQAGFNTMVHGLRERERMRDLFGRHVGEDVAHHALTGEAGLGGQVRDVAVVFVDLVGSTRLAATRPPGEVVELLNSFFAVVIDVVEKHGGWINKFEGDAALAIFGAPNPVDDHAGRALRAGRTLAARLRREVFVAEFESLGAGIGISAGEAVAGNIGARQRFEYTVIGDPVNEAARLCDAAKEFDGGVLASRAALALAGAEDERWRHAGDRQLRGRTEHTTLAVPLELET